RALAVVCILAVDSGRRARGSRADSSSAADTCSRSSGRILAVSGAFVVRGILVLVAGLVAVGVIGARGDGGGDSADSRGGSRDTGTCGSGPGTGRIPLGGVGDFLIGCLGVVFGFEIGALIGAGALLLRRLLAAVDAGGEGGGGRRGRALGIAEVQLGLGHLRARLGQSRSEFGGIGGTVRRILRRRPQHQRVQPRTQAVDDLG